MKEIAHMHVHHQGEGLTKNQSLVLDTLMREGGPLSAYGILDRLRDKGLRAPLQVYRALEKLVTHGKVHRLESLNAFVACSHPGCDNQEAVIFTICSDCGKVDEITDAGLGVQLQAVAHRADFKLAKSTVELRGHCNHCS
ncbi:MAG: Fur family transcriptional regulator [Nitratireductor sp.]